jgi:hypothetical protein
VTRAAVSRGSFGLTEHPSANLLARSFAADARGGGLELATATLQVAAGLPQLHDPARERRMSRRRDSTRSHRACARRCGGVRPRPRRRPGGQRPVPEPSPRRHPALARADTATTRRFRRPESRSSRSDRLPPRGTSSRGRGTRTRAVRTGSPARCGLLRPSTLRRSRASWRRGPRARRRSLCLDGRRSPWRIRLGRRRWLGRLVLLFEPIGMDRTDDRTLVRSWTVEAALPDHPGAIRIPWVLPRWGESNPKHLRRPPRRR